MTEDHYKIPMERPLGGTPSNLGRFKDEISSERQKELRADWERRLEESDDDFDSLLEEQIFWSHFPYIPID